MRKAKIWFNYLAAVMFIMFAVLSYVPVEAKPKAAPKVVIVSQPKSEYQVGDRVLVKFNSPNYSGVVQYRAFLWNATTKKFVQEIYKDYPGYYYKPVCVGKSVFTIDVFYPQEPGTYYIGILVKPKGAKVSYSSYVYTKTFVVKAETTAEQQITLDRDGQVYGPENKADSITTDKDIYIKANNTILRNIITKGTIVVDPGKDGNATLKNVTAANIKVLSGGKNSIHLESVDAGNLIVSSDSEVRVEATGTTAIDNTVVTCYSILDANGGSLGAITVARNEAGKFTVQLLGTFNEPIVVETGVTLIADKNAAVSKVEIAPQSSSQEINLVGNFNQVEVNKAARVELGANTTVQSLVANANVEVTADRTSKVQTVDNKNGEVKVSGEGAGNIPVPHSTQQTPSQSGSGGGGGGGGGYTPPQSIAVTGLKSDVIAALMNVNDTIPVVTTVLPSNATNKKIAWATSNENVAVINNDTITAKSAGDAVITAKTEDGNYTVTINVKVLACDITSKILNAGDGISISISNSVKKDDIVTVEITDSNQNLKYVDQITLVNGSKTVSTKLDKGAYKVRLRGLKTDVIEFLLNI